MRLVKVSAPAEKSSEVIKLAFSAGIEKISKHQVEQLKPDSEAKTKEVIEIETSTPTAQKFIDSLLAADFYDRNDFSVAIRQPRSILSSQNLPKLTQPMTVPATDLLEELWQFSQITISFVGRFFIAGCFLAFGLINQQILVIIAGLLFLPLLPLLLSISFGARSKQWRLAGQGGLALATALVLLVLSGVSVAAFSAPPIKYDEFNSLPIGFLISVAVGTAAGLASIDDAGRRELIGLAATAQLAIIPVWFGICFVLGFPATVEKNEIIGRAISLLINSATIIVSAFVVYFWLAKTSFPAEKLGGADEK